MAVFRVEKTRDYTVMANHHLKNRALTLKAKGLLSLMLSLPEDWDYTLKGLSLISVEGVDAIREAVRELERAGYIIRYRERNGQGQLKGTEYVIYEHPRLPEARPGMGNPAQENTTLDNSAQEKPMLGPIALAEPTLENSTQFNTKRVKTHLENTQIINPYGTNPHLFNLYDLMDVDGWRQTIKENIDYDILLQDHRNNRDRLDEIIDLIVETLCSTKPTICVSGDDFPAALVKEKLLKLDSQHIDYVFECLDKNITYVRNIKKYLLATLFNAPSTIDSYYSAMVNHDLYGDGSRGR